MTSNTARALRENTVLVRRPLSDEAPSRAILHAFSELDVGLPTTGKRLADVADPDAIDRLVRTAGENVRISMVLWEHPVVVTTEEVRVFGPSTHDR
jgi:hypothetical protein